MNRIRVAHVSAWCGGGALAMVRIHQGLLDAGIHSRIHSVEKPDESIRDAYVIPRIRKPRLQRFAEKLLPSKALNKPDHWPSKIKYARRANAACEVFSPPFEISRHDLSRVFCDIDVLHLHWVGGFFDFKDVFSSLDVPVVWTMHDQNPYFGGFHYQGDLDAATALLPIEYRLREIKAAALEKVTLAVAGNSAWNTSLAMTTGVLPPGTVAETVYLPLPIEDYVAIEKRVSKSSLGIDADTFVIGFASAALENRRKGFGDLVEAIGLLPESLRRRSTLLSFGRQPDPEIRQSLDIAWKHLGYQSPGEQQSQAYSAMDAFVIASLEEAFGQTLLEALACQTAVIGTEVGGIPETVQDGKTGLLVPKRSPHRIAMALQRMHAHPEFRTACGWAGRQLALDRHDPAKIARQYQSLYERLIARSRSAAA